MKYDNPPVAGDGPKEPNDADLIKATIFSTGATIRRQQTRSIRP
jgi:hypothetical protein